MTMLLHSESVRRELGLSTDQATTIGPAVEQASLSLWRLRDLPPDVRDRATRPLLESLRTTLAATLTPLQLNRLDQLVVRRWVYRLHWNRASRRLWVCPVSSVGSCWPSSARRYVTLPTLPAHAPGWSGTRCDPD